MMISLSLHAQVNQSELEEGQTPVSFINYEGPHARIETRVQIRNIGFVLGQAVRGGNNSPGTRGRYFVIHAAGPEDGQRLDADIFGLGPDTGVDHIRNLRLIVQGYLEGAYLYSARDAALLAEYVTVYNAVYRGDWEYINFRYKDEVIAELDQERAGLSIRFDEWPGRTLMLIPMGTGAAGSLSALDTAVVGDPQVVEELRKDEDRGVTQRQDMVDLKEREADEAGERAEEQREEADREQRQIDQERQQLEEDRRQAQPARPEQEAQPVQRPAQGPPVQDERPNREQAPADSQAAPEQRQPDPREEEFERREAELDRRQEAVDERREEAQRNEDFAAQKREEAREERESIARDQQELINQDNPPEEEGRISAVLNDRDSPLGQFVKLDRNGEELRRSAVNTVNVRTIVAVEDRIIAVAGENRGSGAIRLIEVDRRTLDMKAQGEDDIHPQSLLWVNGTDLYAITVTGGAAYLGRFNPGLVRQTRSAETVHPYAALIFQEGLILTQRQDGSALVLDAQTLEARN
ncbi:MAG: hypothetical protein LBQ46_11030 [Treponema sp.]|jgi:hypothetical protein|nr:hypothetical protein [Treponema sp.]